MNPEFTKIIAEKLIEEIKNTTFKNKFIVIFGYNSPGDFVVEFLKSQNIYVDLVIDNNPLNKGKKLLGVDVLDPLVLTKVEKEIVVLISSKYYEEMKDQINELLEDKNKKIIQLINLNEAREYSVTKEDFEKKEKIANKGLEIYKNIVGFSNTIPYFFINPIKANGDIFIFSSFLKSYLRKNNIKNYYITLVGNVGAKITALFDIENVVVVSQEEMKCLIQFSNIIDRKKLNIFVTQPYFTHFYLNSYIEGYKGLTFIDFYRKNIFDLSDDEKPEKPKFNKDIDFESKYDSRKLVKGKTVIIAPYTNSLPSIDNSFWEELVVTLLNKGFNVITNSASESEKILKNTSSVFFAIDEIVPVCEYANNVISLRSGFSELTCTARCKNIILYPDKACGFSKVKDVYSLNDYYEDASILELEFSSERYRQIIENIVDYLTL